MVVRDPNRPTARRRLARNGDVSSQRDQDADPRRLEGSTRRAVGGECLCGCAEVELDARGEGDPRVPAVELDLAPVRIAYEGRASHLRAVAHHREGGVVAGQPEGASDGRIDQPVGRARRVQRDGQRLEQQGAHPGGFAAGCIELHELGVGAEPAAGAVDRGELRVDDPARFVERTRLSDGERGSRAERPPGDRRHEPPETATGGLAGTAGSGGAGGGAREPAEGGRAGGSGGTVWLRGRTVGRRLTVLRGCVPLAATPAKTPDRSTAMPTATPLRRRSRASAASRASLARAGVCSYGKSLPVKSGSAR